MAKQHKNRKHKMTDITANISVITININGQITSKNLYDLQKKNKKIKKKTYEIYIFTLRPRVLPVRLFAT